MTLKEIAVFKAERDAGLENLVRDTVSLAYTSKLVVSEQFSIADSLLQKIHTRAGETNSTLHYLKSLLVSTGWNNNDDVFDVLETWVARHSPEDTPFNLEHQCDQIIGHIVGNYVIDEAGNLVAEDTLIDNLPCSLHIVTPSVLYKAWEKPELQERTDKLLAEIAEGKWFVSMECYFKGFDYALRDSDGSTRTVARNEQTAFLTKHLRCYGGSGKYDGQKVGRVLRSICFSGKGLVQKPANPDSIIFADAAKSLGYQVLQTANSKKHERAINNMNEIEKQLAEAKAEVEQLKTQLRDNDVKQVQAKLEDAQAEVAKLKDGSAAAADAGAKMAEANKTLLVELEKANTKAVALGEELKKATDELTAIKETQRKAERLSKLKSALKVDEKNAEAVAAVAKITESLAGLSDEQFSDYVASQAKLTHVPAPPKTTPAPLPPKSTNLPAPLLGQASETDPNDGAADTDLEKAEAEKAAALAVAGEQDGVQKLRLSFASLMGYEAPKDE